MRIAAFTHLLLYSLENFGSKGYHYKGEEAYLVWRVTEGLTSVNPKHFPEPVLAHSPV